MNHSTRTAKGVTTSILFSAATLVLVLFSASRHLLAAGKVARPNLILFLIDDQDYESIACYGGDTWTPNLDRMAREGMRFTRAYVSSTVCTPSRYSWLTGRYAGASTSKVYEAACGGPEHQGFPSFNVALERDRMNVGNILRQAGYTTGFVGKFHVASPLDFPEFYEGQDGLRPVPKDAAPGAEATRLFAHNERVMRRYIEQLGFSYAANIYPGNLQPPYAHHNPEWTIEAALEFIEANKDRPFYLHCCTTLLHGPDRSWRSSMDHPLDSGVGRLTEPATGMKPRAELLRAVAEHGFDPDRGGVAGQAWIDDALGAVLNKLRQLGLSRNTLVVFAPDHGSKGKASLFDQGGTRIPMIAWWPGRIPAGVVCDELVQNIDWVPTAFDLAGVRPPQEYRLDGRSLVPLFDTGRIEGWRDDLYFELGYARGITTKDWSYIAVRYPTETIEAIRRASPARLPRLMAYIGRMGIGTRGADHPGFWDQEQLYDLNKDPGQQANLAADPRYADRRRELREKLATRIQLIGRPFGEFLPGGNSALPGQVALQRAIVKRIRIQGKRVLVPPDLSPGSPASKRRHRQTDSPRPKP